MNSPQSAAWIVAGLTVLAFALRWVGLDQSLFGDELFLYAIVHDHSLGEVMSIVHDTEKTPALGFVLSWAGERVSDSPEVIRVPSFVASVASVPLVYLLGLRTVGRGAAVVAAAWLALSPFQLFYGTEARGYAVVTAFVVLSTLALLSALETRRMLSWALYVVAAAAAIYTHYIAALVLVPQAAWALWAHRGQIRQQLFANGVVILAFLPWVPSFVVQARHSAIEARFLSTVAPVTLSHVSEISGMSLMGHPFAELRDLPGRVALGLAGGLLAVLLLAVAHRRWIAGTPLGFRSAARAWLLVLLAVTPLASLILYSLRPDTSFLLPRNLSVAVPYAVLLFGWLLTRPSPRLAALLSGAALAVIAIGTVKMLSPDYQRPDARGAAEYLDAHAAPRTPIIDVQTSAFYRPPARGTRTYLHRPHRIYPASAWNEVWAMAARTRSSVFVSFSDVPYVVAFLVVPEKNASRFRLVDERTSRGAPYSIAVRRYAPR